MTLLANFILSHKKAVVVFFSVAALAGLCLWPFVSVNYDVSDYLPEEAPSTNATDIMEKEFTDSVPNIRVMVSDVSIEEALRYKEQLEKIDGISGVTWLDDVVDLRVPLETQDPDLVESYYKDGNALLSMTVRKGDEIPVINAIYELIGEDGAATGQAVNAYNAQIMSGSETRKAIMIVVPLILVILLLSTTSWVEPIIYILAIAIAVFINMGTNIAFDEISFISSSVSPIMQLAVSLDYAIFLLHSFQAARREGLDEQTAMANAMKRAIPTIMASAFTTIFGFAALCFMEFRVGFDMGLGLVKGVALSLICATIFLPALALLSYKIIDRTQHRPLLPTMAGIGKPLLRVGIPIVIIILMLIAPVFMAQSRIGFIYGMGGLAHGTRAETDGQVIEDAFGKDMPIAILVPRGETGKELLLSEDLAATPHITSVVSYAKSVGSAIPVELLDEDQRKQFYSEHYARIILYSDTEDEGAVPFALVEQIRDACATYYDTYYVTGENVTLYDMKDVVTRDNRLINYIAICSIAFVLVLMFRSISLPVFLLLTIETSIWISMSYNYFFNSPLSYIGYLIVSAVQLGATVDYAILYTDHYVKERRVKLPREAARTALGETFRSILTSAIILAGAGFAMSATSTNAIVQSLGLLIGRGALLSFFLTTCFLPTVLRALDGVVRVTTLNTKFLRKGRSAS